MSETISESPLKTMKNAFYFPLKALFSGLCISRPPALVLAPGPWPQLPVLAPYLYLPALAPNLYLPVLAPNLYLPTLAPKL